MTVSDHLDTVRPGEPHFETGDGSDNPHLAEWHAYALQLESEVERLRAALTEAQAQAVNSLSGTGRYKAEAEVVRLRAELAAMEKERDEWVGHAATAAQAKDDLTADLASAHEALRGIREADDARVVAGGEPRGWDETTPTCAGCGRIVCMCPAGNET